MIQINRLKLDIQGYSEQNTEVKKRYGFNIPFKKGLNVIKGENTSGKSTIVSCLFYSLCLEEILGAKNMRALDNSVKKEFEIEDEIYQVFSSYTYIEIQNDKGQVRTIKRSIKGNKSEEFLLKIFNGRIEDLNSTTDFRTVFIHRERNHESEIGFFRWFAEFLGFPKIPKVLNQKGEYADLYLQTIFPAMFIEQTKGWSDLLASIPYFGLKDNKQRTVEFLMQLKALTTEVEKEKLLDTRKKLISEWKVTIDRINILATANSGKFTELPDEPLLDAEDLKHVSLDIMKDVDSDEFIHIDNMILLLKEKKQSIDISPKLVIDRKPELRQELENKKNEYAEFVQKYKQFSDQFQAQKYQLKSYESHVRELQEEIEVNKDIKYLTEKDPTINELESCPTCHQEFGSSILGKDLSVEFKTIKGNLEYLRNQEKLLTSSIESLIHVLSKKEILDTTFRKAIADLEARINQIKNELIDPDLMPSRSQIHEVIRLENEINRYSNVKSDYVDFLTDLKSTIEEFGKNKREMDSLESHEVEDIEKLNKFEVTFKQLLYEFDYTSNKPYHVHIQKRFPFKYFPISHYGKEIQKIQLSSSASDFIRSIWAYTISLLINAEIHPGIILFDEPSQHSMKSHSLRKFFEELSKLKHYQIIVAASTDKKDRTEDRMPYTVDNILRGLDYHEYEIKNKSIHEIVD